MPTSSTAPGEKPPTAGRTAARPPAPAPSPLIPVELCDVPTQRLYVASTLALLQAYKLWHFVEAFAAGSGRNPAAEWATWAAWTLVDAVVFGVIIPGLRIPRLRFGVPQRLVLCVLAAVGNWALFGSWSFSLQPLAFVIPAFVKGTLFLLAFERKHVADVNAMQGCSTTTQQS